MKSVAEAAEKVVAKAAPQSRRRRSAEFSVEENWPETKREIRPLSKIYPHPKNPRTHPPAQLALLSALLKKYGPDQDIVVDEDGVILKGHGRHAAATLGGLREFPVTVRFGLSEAEKVEMRIADNAVALLAGWDQELIRGDINFLKTSGSDLTLLGFGEAQLVQFTAAPKPPDGFQQFGDDIDVKFCCPRCRYSWSGNPMAGADPAEVRKAEKEAGKNGGRRR